MKEAWLKARGVGLAGDLQALDTSGLAPAPDGWRRHAPDGWYLTRRCVMPRRWLGIAAARPLPVRIHGDVGAEQEATA